MTELDFSFLNWQVLSDFVAKGFFFSIQLTVVAMLGGIASAPCWR
jgi:glutamate/aspartate transport system permease protein